MRINGRYFSAWSHCFYAISMFCACFFAGCGNRTQTQTYKIGFSQSGEADEWRQSMLEEMKRELFFHPELQLLVRESHDNSQKQIQQVRELLQEHIDVLIISASEADALTPVVEEVYRAHIPVIVIDRKIASDNYTNHIGADNFQIGEMAGKYLAEKIHGAGNLVKITGMVSSSPAIERASGFANALKGYPHIHLKASFTGNWTQNITELALERNLAALDNVDGIFAQNDVMGLGAYTVLQKAKKANIPIVGVDAMSQLGLKLIREKKFAASLLYPTGGKEAIRNAALLAAHREVPRQTTLQTLVVDSNNVEMMQLQSDKLLSQQQDIEKQQDMLLHQLKISRSQRTSIIILGVLLLLLLVVAGLLFYSRRLNRKINQQLEQKNADISRQSEALIVMSEKANEANEAKLNFFTKLSHEFRTPLTLIITPVEELLDRPKISPEQKSALSFIRKNAFRLLLLVNQLMDIRKIEFGKFQLRVSENDMVAFCNDIVQSFQSLAQKRNIDCRFLTRQRNLKVWFDADVLEKILFNLLSNAFKFTPDGGSVTLELSTDTETKKLVLRLQDTGIGMTADEQKRAFDLFYQSNNEKMNGTGIGLNLTKELVQMHKGTIELKSEKNLGSTFTLLLPLENVYSTAETGVVHSENSGLAGVVDTGEVYLSALLTDHETLLPEPQAPAQQSIGNKKTILLIEDNNDLMQLLARQYSSQYEFVTAADGNAGFKKAFEVVPDLVICDIMLPGLDGLSITRQLKNDIRTAHIPVILLTAKASEAQQLEGLKNKADAYITKPFNLKMLTGTIETILHNYERQKEHFTSLGGHPVAAVGEGGTLQEKTGMPLTNAAPRKKTDRRFSSDFISIVERNLANEHFSIDDICKEMQVSKIQLYRKVKAFLNTNVNEYILNARIQKAKYYLQNEDLTITEIAYKTGFSTPTYFSTVFKSKAGSTPKEFRKLHTH